jgi:ABC-2 type transport system ATP-binding protein
MAGECLIASGLTRRHPNGLGVFEMSLFARPGDVVGVLGPNGSGKTTLLRVLATLDPPTSGGVTWFGLADRRSPAVRRRLGVVLDRPVHFEALTGRQNAEFFAAQYGVPRLAVRRRVEDLLEWAGLQRARELPVAEFSLGMRRRLSLVEALCHEPDLLLLDEPSLALDGEGEVDLAWQLHRAAARGAAVVVATNDEPLAAAVCARALRLDRGRAREAT